MAIPQSFIDELLARTDIIEIIDQRVPLRKRGSNHVACCPFHNEKTPSFSVSQSKQIYHCFGCGAGGNAISFLMNYDRLSFTDAIEQLANNIGLALPEISKSAKSNQHNSRLYELMAGVSGFYRQQLRYAPEAIAYLKQRGLDGNIAKRYALGYASNAWNGLIKAFPLQIIQLHQCGLLIKNDKGRYYDRFRDRIMFPIRNSRGQVIGFGGRIITKGDPKYLNSPETPLFHKGSELYGIYEAHQANRNLERLLIVEGYMDVITLAQFGVNYAVATLGTATTPEHIKKLFRYCNELIFCFDGDTAGQAAAWKALEILLPFMEDGRQVRFFILPSEHDPDSYIRVIGLEAFKAEMQTAIPLENFLFEKFIKQVDMESPAEQASLAHELGQKLMLLPKGTLQKILLERLAKLIGVNTRELLTIIQGQTKPYSPSNGELRTEALPLPSRRPKRSLTHTAIAIMLQHPELVQQLTDTPTFDGQRSKSINLLNELTNTLKANPKLSTSTIIERWRDHPYESLLQSLLNYPLDFPIEHLVTELQDTFKRIAEQLQTQFIERQLQLLKQNKLSQEEKIHLSQLLQSKQ